MIRLRVARSSTDAESWRSSQHSYLFFIRQGTKEKDYEDQLVGRWLLCDYQPPINLNKPERIYKADRTKLNDGAEILPLVRRWAFWNIGKERGDLGCRDSPKCLRLVDFGALYDEVNLGSAVYIVVPAKEPEEKYRERFTAMAQSSDPNQRQKAAAELYKFPSEETTAVLRKLLKDTTESPSYFADDIIDNYRFSVRAEAYLSLVRLGEKVPETVLGRPATQEEQSALRSDRWQRHFLEVLPNDWQITVSDGETRRIGDREWTIVIVSLQSGPIICKLILIPKEWPPEDDPAGGYLGTDGPSSQGGRRFYIEGDIPEDVKTKVIRYFGLAR